MSDVENKLAPRGALLGWVCMVALLLLLVAIYFMHNFSYSVDDSFITYRYALHLKEGEGLVFNLGERYYGTTAVGYAVLLALATKLLQLIGSVVGIAALQNIDVPQVSVLCSAIALSVISLMSVVILRPGTSLVKWMLSMVAALVLFSAYPFNEVAGHETYAFLAAALSAAVMLFVKNRPVMAAVLFALATSFRPDAVLSIVAALVVDWRLARSSLKSYLLSQRTLQLILVYGALILCLLLSLAYYYGSPLPGTLAAKKVQVELGYWPLYSVKVLGTYVIRALGVLGMAFVGLGLLLLAAFWMHARRRGLMALPRPGVAALISTGLFGAISVTGYLLLNVTFWQWYGVPIAFCLLAVGAAGWVYAIDAAVVAADSLPLQHRWMRRLLPALPALLLVILAGSSLKDFSWWAHNKNINPHIAAYTEIVDYIKQQRPDGAVIQMIEPGSFAYRLGSKYKVVDELGLISPGVAQALKRKDSAFLVDSAKPDYLVCSWKGTFTICDTELANSRFELVGAFNKDFWQPNLGDGARLFRARQPGKGGADASGVAMAQVSDVVLGDLWGKVQASTAPRELFVHPGAKTATMFSFDCRAECAAVRLTGHIAELPKDAPAIAGSVGVTVLDATGAEVVPRVVIDRQHPLPATVLKTVQHKVSIKVDNNGDPSFDWLILGLE